MNRNLYFTCVFLSLASSLINPLSSQSNIQWNKWTELPGNPVLEKEGISPNQPGLAGAYSGMSGDVLIIAGGANFPYKLPWEEGEKVYWDQVYCARIDMGGNPQWQETDNRLPVPMAYGVVVQFDDEVVVIGGENKDGIVSDVFAVRWDRLGKKLELSVWPSLPDGFKSISGGIIEGTIVVHGVRDGQNVLLQYGSDSTWSELSGCPGPPRYYPASQVQSMGQDEGFFLFSGRTQDKSGKITLLHDGYMYDAGQKTWKALGELPTNSEGSECLMGASSAKSGDSQIIIFGGDNGRDLIKRQEVLDELDTAKNGKRRMELKDHLDSLFVNHVGFSSKIWVYHTIKNTWVIQDSFPGDLPVTTNAFTWNNQYFIVSGEIHPGIRTPVIWKGTRTE